jgi:hypothetical protein
VSESDAVDFAKLSGVVLAPLADRPVGDWHRAAPGQWSAAQIVEHLTLTLERTADAFERAQAGAPMTRRPRTPQQEALYHLILDRRVFPPGGKAPTSVTPGDHVDPAATTARLHAVVARWLNLVGRLGPARAADLFVRHGAVGDLTLGEWLRWHVVHADHHVAQIVARLSGDAHG